MNEQYTEEVVKYAKEMELTALYEYTNGVFAFLMDMDPGDKIPVKNLADPETIDLFKAVVKMYMDEAPWPYVEFTENYESIRRIRA